MTEGERIVLGDEGEGDSDDSDPVLVTGEASVWLPLLFRIDGEKIFRCPTK